MSTAPSCPSDVNPSALYPSRDKIKPVVCSHRAQCSVCVGWRTIGTVGLSCFPAHTHLRATAALLQPHNSEGTEISRQVFCPSKTRHNRNVPAQLCQLLFVKPFFAEKASPSCKATHCSSYQEGKDYIPLNDSHSSEDDGFSQVPSSAQQNSDEEDFDMRIRCHSLAAR